MQIMNSGKIRGKTLDVPPSSHALIVDGVEYEFEIANLPGDSFCSSCAEAYDADGGAITGLLFSLNKRKLRIPICDRCKKNQSLPFSIHRALYNTGLLSRARPYSIPQNATIRWIDPKPSNLSNFTP